LPVGGWPAWTGSNHDMSRLATRWAGNDPAKTRAALVLLLGLRGTPVLYQGDEIGLRDADVQPPHLRDPLGEKYWPAYKGRDAMRTPLPWRDAPNGGFTDPAVSPWLPLDDTSLNVAEQRDDPASILTLTRDLLALRKRTSDLNQGAYQRVDAPHGVWAWRRGDAHVVAVNLSDTTLAIHGLTGVVLLATDRDRDNEQFDGRLRLAAWEGVVVRLSRH